MSKKEEEVIFKLRSWGNECWATAKLVARACAALAKVYIWNELLSLAAWM